MQIKKWLIGLILTMTSAIHVNAQYSQDDTYKDCFVGSTLAMFGNLDTEHSPEFVQLNLGYRLSGKDVVSLELKTWKYEWSLGIPWSSFQEPEEIFPGYIREYGFALVYQRYWWKGLYTGIHMMNAWQTFVDNQGQKVDNGFQLFNTYRLGYHVKLFKGKFFIEPSIAITHRAYHTEMPESFKELDDQWPKYFIGEPGLHFGYNF